MRFQIVIPTCVMMALNGCSRHHSSIEAAVRANDVQAVRTFIRDGSDFRRGSDGGDLVYPATGPGGRTDVLRELLKAGA